MKLISKKTYYLGVLYLLIFLVGGLLYYYVTEYVIERDFDNYIRQRKILVLHQLEKSDSIIGYQGFSDHRIEIIKQATTVSLQEHISDTLLLDDKENKYQLYRQLEFPAHIKGWFYVIRIRRLLIETDQLAAPLFFVSVLWFILFMIFSFWGNQWVSNRLWKPFYYTLQKLKAYKPSETRVLSFSPTHIDEFDELNAVIYSLTQRLNDDFSVLKEFTENTSHELQTPLSVIKSKLELLMQEENFTDLQYKHLSVCLETVTKLSKLNEALGLLCKIENSQFPEKERIDLFQLIRAKLSHYEELLSIRSIKVAVSKEDSFWVNMNALLADILIENLLNNAIKHNIEEGYINVSMPDAKTLMISNTGKALQVKPDYLFQRFHKSNSKSFGLGLSIVREICILQGLSISYSCQDQWHSMRITMDR